jgi:hypothetical protein
MIGKTPSDWLLSKAAVGIADVLLEVHNGKLMCYVYDSYYGDPVAAVTLLEDARDRAWKEEE